jgi:hypothetical protein
MFYLHEHESRKEISTPEANILLKIGGGNGRQTTDVDTPVEHVENLLVAVNEMKWVSTCVIPANDRHVIHTLLGE